MATEPGKAICKERAKAECVNAWARRMGLPQLLVRGKRKARAVLLWFALAHSMLRSFASRRPAKLAADQGETTTRPHGRRFPVSSPPQPGCARVG
jgi:hypothetical protein